MQETKVVENEIPDNAFSYKPFLTSFVFPDGNHDNCITRIGKEAFRSTILSGSLLVPEPVQIIDWGAFIETKISSVSFPESLTVIDESAFSSCNQITGSLILPPFLKQLKSGAFAGCSGLSGQLSFPPEIEELGGGAFFRCSSLSGVLVIPPSITHIYENTFSGCEGLSSLILNEGLTFIGSNAFQSCHLKGELALPSTMVSIEDGAFSNNNFSGTLKMPSSLINLEEYAFANNPSLSGVIVFPGSLSIIEARLFEGCSSLGGIILHSGIEQIGHDAFANCYGLQSIICENETPPYLGDGAFSGVPKDNFAIEVPENSVHDYAFASGWNEFLGIVPHRDFAIGRRLFKTLNPEESRTFILRAESGFSWSIENKPEWVTVSPLSGTGKTDVTVTVNSLTVGSGNRSGDVVFLLNGKDYRCTLTVEQYDYAYSDGSVKTEYTHTVGSGIPIVFLGDCYDAADIASGSYLADTEEAIGYFFDVEPYKTYKNYFDVYVVFGKSEDSGVGSVNTIREAKFGTQYDLTGGSLINGGAEAFAYAKKADPNMDITKGLVVMVLNSTDYGGVTHMWNDGSAIALCPKSTDPYPYDFRGLVQHEAGGHGFGKLADEYIYVNAFIDACSCSNAHLDAFLAAKSSGWYKNLSETANRDEVPWSHLMYHPTYSNTVDIYEGGFFHTRGIFRSEPNSCMNNNIPYYSAISRQAIVERIMDYAGVPFNIDDFYANDAAAIGTRASVAAAPAWVPNSSASTNLKHHHPIIMGDHPIVN